MKHGHVLDELSAYIDGEARNPAGIARHLQFCETCARRHMELLKISANVRGMPSPSLRPEFLTRVLAEVAEEEARRAAVRRTGWGLLSGQQWALAAAAALVLIMGAVSWQVLMGTADIQRQEDLPLQAEDVTPVLEDTLAAAFERLLIQGVDPNVLTDAEAIPEESAGEVPLEVVLELLADSSGAAGPGEELESEDENAGIFDSLDQAEAAAFHDVLREYVQELSDQGNAKG